jgi:hypothetical protein
LVDGRDPTKFAELVNGTIVWPDTGLASTLTEGACKVNPEIFKNLYTPKCKLGWNDWEGSVATSFADYDPAQQVDVL